MIPLRLELRNFLSYGESAPVLSLESIHVACLSGSNGNGKSALLDAMVWALWGEPRGGARAGDDLIRQGARDMAVCLEFSMDGDHYRVERTRTMRQRSGVTELHFEAHDGKEWRSLSQGTVAQTQQAIEQLIRMTHDTFVHASFIQQGKADAFMSITPQQRKQVLGDVLGLGQYDELAEAAREAARTARSESERLAGLITGIENELAKREHYQAELAEAERIEADADGEQNRLDQERTVLLQEVQRLVSIEREAAERATAMIRAEEDIRALTREVGELEVRYQAAAGIVEESAAVEADFETFRRLDAEEQSMASLFDQWRLANDALRATESGIEREESRLAAEHKVELSRAAELERGLLSGADDEKQVQDLSETLTHLDAVAAQITTHSAQLEAGNARLAGLRQEGERLRTEPERVHQRIELLGQHDECPLCGQQLGEHGLAAAQTRLQEELQAAEQRLTDMRKEWTVRSAEVKKTQELVLSLRGQVEQRSALERQLGELQAKMQRAASDRSALGEIRARAEQLALVLESQDFAHDLRRQLAEQHGQLKAIAYDPDRHRELREARAKSNTAPDRMRQLAEARATLESADLHRTSLSERRIAAVATRDRMAEEHKTLILEAERLPAVRAALETGEQALQDAAARRRQASQAVGVCRQMISWLDARETEHSGLIVDRDARSADHSAYSQLTDAFGKNGIQEMILEHVLPEIEDSANELLGRLSAGRLRVRLRQQRTGRGGQVSSTLDIYVSDELGERPYELFSGGERFRIDFAVRIALSRLLAHRANAPLQMLAIDEGFGSQDREGCDRLVEAIRAIQDDFEKILVITHLEDLKDAFPVRIEVTKNQDGSTFVWT